MGAKQRGLGDRLRDGLRDCGDRLGLGLELVLGDRLGLGQDGHSHVLTALENCAAAGHAHCGRIENPNTVKRRKKKTARRDDEAVPGENGDIVEAPLPPAAPENGFGKPTRFLVVFFCAKIFY